MNPVDLQARLARWRPTPRQFERLTGWEWSYAMKVLNGNLPGCSLFYTQVNEILDKGLTGTWR